MKHVVVTINLTIFFAMAAVVPLLTLYMNNRGVAADTAYYMELGEQILNRYTENLQLVDHYPMVQERILPDSSIISTLERVYGLDGHVGLDMGTYTRLIIDVRTAIGITGDVQLALDLANYINDHIAYQRSFFDLLTSMFTENSFIRIDLAAIEIQELLSNGSSNLQNAELIERIDVLLNRIFIGYALMLDEGQIQALQEYAPRGSSDSEVYDFLISRINRCYRPDAGFIFR